jgi:glyoxylase I family protein
MFLNSFHHICIQTENYSASLAFYVDLLGFEIVKETTGFHTRNYNTWLEGAGVMIELQTPKKGTKFTEWSSLNSGPVHICFIVEDVTKAYQTLKEKGYNSFKIKNGKELYEVKGSPLFKVKAPEGTEIEIRENGVG